MNEIIQAILILIFMLSPIILPCLVLIFYPCYIDSHGIMIHNCPKIKLNSGKLHCLTGPAVSCIRGHNEWYINGEKINVSSQEEFKRYLKLKPFW